MADLKAKYGAAEQAITITLASLANNGARESTKIDNQTDLFLDALVQLVIKTGATGVSTGGTVQVYAYGTVDDDTSPIYGDGATGTDAAITLTSPPNLRIIGTMNCVANATTYKSNPMSVAAAFSGVLPNKWGIVVVNKTGAAFDSTEGNHGKKYQGVLGQSV